MAIGNAPFRQPWGIDAVEPIPAFTLSCHTDVHFGCGVHQDLLALIPAQVNTIVVVKGVSNAPSAPVRLLLSNAGYSPIEVACAGEPSIRSINAILEKITHTSIDCIVACGGGSTMDTAKALRVALQKGAPLTDGDFATRHDTPSAIALIVVPTTAGTGAEVTANAVLGANEMDAKVSLRGRTLQPDTALVDPDLLRSAPKSVVLHAGLDAVVQNIEAACSALATPFTRALSGPAIPSTLRALRDVLEEDSPAAWSQLAWGSLSSGIALANGGLGAVHGLASILGGAYQAPHGALCGRLLTPVLRANLAAPNCPYEARQSLLTSQAVLRDLFAPVDPDDPLSGFDAWLSMQGLPRLSHWGVNPEHITALAKAATGASSSLKNPVQLDAAALTQVLRAAL
ncbi:MAG: iron-containing alcohol dehydrogenase [Maritimibacter sp.]